MLWENALRKMTLTRSTPHMCMSIRHSPCLHITCVCPSLAHRQNLLSSLKTTECHSTLQSTLSQHHSSSAWQCGSLDTGTHDLSPTASRWFPMVLGDTAGAIPPDPLSGLLVCNCHTQTGRFHSIPTCPPITSHTWTKHPLTPTLLLVALMYFCQSYLFYS